MKHLTHLKSCLTALALVSALPAVAAPNPTLETYSRVLKDTTTDVAVALNAASVFCTARGYSSVQLKVSLPDLDWLAHFDHRVVGETLPCITGGACSEMLQPGKLIDPLQPFAMASVRVRLFERMIINETEKTCTRQLTERVDTHLRGTPFVHFQSGPDTAVDFQRCLAERSYFP